MFKGVYPILVPGATLACRRHLQNLLRWQFTVLKPRKVKKVVTTLLLVFFITLGYAQQKLPIENQLNPWSILNRNNKDGLYLKTFLQLLQDSTYVNSNSNS